MTKLVAKRGLDYFCCDVFRYVRSFVALVSRCHASRPKCERLAGVSPAGLVDDLVSMTGDHAKLPSG